MKFSLSTVLLTANVLASVSAFSAIAPRKVSTPATNIDKTMSDLKDSDDAFDPTSGDHPAVTRNNKDEVWVSQVCVCVMKRNKRRLYLIMCFIVCHDVDPC